MRNNLKEEKHLSTTNMRTRVGVGGPNKLLTEFSTCSVRGFSPRRGLWVLGLSCFWLRDGDGGKQMED